MILNFFLILLLPHLIYVVLVVEARASCLVGKHSTSELYHQSTLRFYPNRDKVYVDIDSTYQEPCNNFMAEPGAKVVTYSCYSYSMTWVFLNKPQAEMLAY